MTLLPSRRQLAYLSCESRTSPAFTLVLVFISFSPRRYASRYLLDGGQSCLQVHFCCVYTNTIPPYSKLILSDGPEPALTFVLVFIGFLLSHPLKAVPMPIANRPNRLPQIAQKSLCDLEIRDQELADGIMPTLFANLQRLSKRIVWE